MYNISTYIYLFEDNSIYVLQTDTNFSISEV